MLRHGCGVSIYHHLYDQIDRRFKMIPLPYVISFVVTKEARLLKEKWLINLAHGIKNILWGFINNIRAVKYWEQKGKQL